MERLQIEAISLAADVVNALAAVAGYSPWAALLLAASPCVPALLRGLFRRGILLAMLGVAVLMFVAPVYGAIGFLVWLILWVVSLWPARRVSRVSPVST